MQRAIHLLLRTCIVLGLAAGLYAALQRYRVERLNRRVEIAVDLQEIKTLAAAARQPIRETLRHLKSVGVTSVAIPEDTLTTLEQQGEASIVRRGSVTTLTLSSASVLQRLREGLANRGYVSSPAPPSDSSESQTILRLEDANRANRQTYYLPADYAVLRPLGFGLDPQAVELVRQAGMHPVGRISNFPGASPQTMRATLDELRQLQIQTVIFQGLETLGYRGQTREAAAALQASGLYYGQVEFGKQKGDASLSAALKGEYVRVHSITEGEMGTLDESEAIDRFERAARERNIRLCYVRLITYAGEDAMRANAAYIHQIARGIQRGSEMQLGPARLFSEPGVPLAVYPLIAAGIAAACALLLSRLFPLSPSSLLLAFGVLLAVCAGATLGLGETGKKGAALLAAFVFPTLACLHRGLLTPVHSPTEEPPPLRPGAAAARALIGIFYASMVTTGGIIAVIGLLAARPYMLKADQFMGIKAAHIVPIFLIGLTAIVGLPRAGAVWRQEWQRIRRRIESFWGEPARIGMLLLTLIALAALMLAVARTGNEPGVGVSGLELKFRALLDNLLPARPRTKEFLIGHPAFVLALALFFRGRRRLTLPLLVVGTIGQVSLLNTFCHIHTPLSLSVIRAVTGLVAGAAMGMALFGLIEWLAGRSSRPAQTCADEPARSCPTETMSPRSDSAPGRHSG
jgi:hypothetical protein